MFANWSEKANFVFWIITADIKKADILVGRMLPHPDYVIPGRHPTTLLPSFSDFNGGPVKMLTDVYHDFYNSRDPPPPLFGALLSL
jgi:hypothetical protein